MASPNLLIKILSGISLGTFLTIGVSLIVKKEKDKQLKAQARDLLEEQKKDELYEQKKAQSKEEIEQSIKVALSEESQPQESDQELKEDFKNKLSSVKRFSLIIYEHDPAFMELYLRQMNELQPGIKRNFKDFLFSKAVFTKEHMKNLFSKVVLTEEHMKNLLYNFNFLKHKEFTEEKMKIILNNIDDSTVNDENLIMKKIDEYNRINEPNIKPLYANYPEFNELQKQINFQQKLISINIDLLVNKNDKTELLNEIQESKDKIKKLEEESNTHKAAKQAIYEESQWVFTSWKVDTRVKAIDVFDLISKHIIELLN